MPGCSQQSLAVLQLQLLKADVAPDSTAVARQVSLSLTQLERNIAATGERKKNPSQVTILLPQLSECYDYRFVLSHLFIL